MLSQCLCGSTRTVLKKKKDSFWIRNKGLANLIYLNINSIFILFILCVCLCVCAHTCACLCVCLFACKPLSIDGGCWQ